MLFVGLVPVGGGGSAFNSIYSHGIIRATVAIPFVRVADPAYNVERTLRIAQQASEINAAICLFPELGISAYSDEDLFHQNALLDASRSALVTMVEASQDMSSILLIGFCNGTRTALNCLARFFTISRYTGSLLNI